MTYQRRSPPRRALGALAGALCLFAAFGMSGTASANEAQKLIDDSAAMARTMLAGEEQEFFDTAYKNAKAVILIPSYLEAGFFLGAGGGQCLIVARSGANGAWSAPSFCMMGEASLGFQLGFQKSEMIMLVMNDAALDEIVSGTAKFGGDAGLAAGFVGRSIKGGTTLNFDKDIYAISRNQGLYGGVVIDGGWIGPDSDYNQAYYGRAVTARHILIDRRVANPATVPLIAALETPNS